MELSKDELRLLKYYRSTNSYGKNAILEMAECYSQTQPKELITKRMLDWERRKRYGRN